MAQRSNIEVRSSQSYAKFLSFCLPNAPTLAPSFKVRAFLTNFSAFSIFPNPYFGSSRILSGIIIPWNYKFKVVFHEKKAQDNMN